MATRELVTAQRRLLADQLSGLSAEDWDRGSLCAGWAVRHVVAHLLMPLRHSMVRIGLGVLLARGDFNRYADRIAHRDGAQAPDQLLRQLRDEADNPWRPPGGGAEAALTDLVVHSLDITRALGLPSGTDRDAIAIVLDQLLTKRSLEFFQLDIRGLRLRALDLDWTRGDGNDVCGPADDLILGLARRHTPLDITGDEASRLVSGAPR